MPLLRPDERAFAVAVSQLTYCNPFAQKRIELERSALGDAFSEPAAVWAFDPNREGDRPNVGRILERLTPLMESMRNRLADGQAASRDERAVYEGMVLYLLYYEFWQQFQRLVEEAGFDHDGRDAPESAPRLSGDAARDAARDSPRSPRPGRRRIAYAAFLERAKHFVDLPGRSSETAPPVEAQALTAPSGHAASGVASAPADPGPRTPAGHDPLTDPAHLFALLFQVRRAFYYIFTFITGASAPAARLRANCWESIFTHDMRRYAHHLYARSSDWATLITGASGTGKELVARAVALSRYIPFDPVAQTFAADFRQLFIPLNLSALSPTLIESELFGHKRGAFTGALEDRPGWLETCDPMGTVFLDEIGDVAAPVQVKLLRVLQSRQFQRLGDAAPRTFAGKIIAATNRDLPAMMREGAFRQDFYYRLCGDMIRTPTLSEQLADSPAELPALLLFIARRIAGDAARDVAAEAQRYIENQLGRGYGWPGNFRELEQCVRNVMVRGSYVPSDTTVSTAGGLERALDSCRLTADQLISLYCRRVYGKTGNYVATAQHLGLDRRTVRARVVADGAAEDGE